MAGSSIGLVGVYSDIYRRMYSSDSRPQTVPNQTTLPPRREHLSHAEVNEETQQLTWPNRNEVSWVLRRYDPLDMRDTAPVPRHKLMTTGHRLNLYANPHYLPYDDPGLRAFDRSKAEQHEGRFVSAPNTREESWSTLREMLPSQGRAYRVKPPRWGTGIVPIPEFVPKRQTSFPRIASEMSSYVDDIYVNNKFFRYQ